MPLRSWFFKDLNNAIKSYTSISMVKLKRIIMNDVIEYILTNRQVQTTRILIKLHQVFGRQILRLSVERYFAIVKKCIF